MKKTLIAIVFAAASLPMFAAQTAPANPPAAKSEAKPSVKTRKAHKKVVRKTASSKRATPPPAPAK